MPKSPSLARESRAGQPAADDGIMESMTGRPHLSRSWGALIVVVLGACATRAPLEPLTFEQAGLVSPRESTSKESATRLEILTSALLSAIERETGERPELEHDEGFHQASGRRARRRARDWNAERTALAAEVLRSTDAREATVSALRRAKAALLWDRLASIHVPTVDRLLVENALGRIASVMPQAPASRPLEFEWPIHPVQITSEFGLRLDPVERAATRLHAGVDLLAVEGQSVYAAGAGEVLQVGRRGGYGLHVDIAHADGLVTRYAHLSSTTVHAGENVDAGDVIGHAGRTGRVTGTHLHFEVRRDEVPVDPLDELPTLLTPALLTRH